MTITRNFKLCLNAGVGLAPYINVNQFDQGEQWVFTLYQEDGTQYMPSTGAIVGIKADNRGIINTGTVDADGRVVINETQQMTAAAGIAIFELLIDGETHGTANFLVNVEQRPGDNADLSDSDLSLIQQAVDSAEVIVEVIGDGDPSEVIGEHVDAWLDNHPEATTTVEDGAITAPKINNSLWDKILVNEEASGAVASFDDGADDVPVSSLKVALEPVQLGSGDPSPSNVRPIIAANGKNILKPTERTVTAGDVTYSVASDGAITLTGTCTSNQSFTIYTGQTVPRTAWYTCSTYGATNGKVNGASSASQSVNAGTAPSGFAVTVTSGTTYNETFYLMLNEGNTAKPYQPYQGISVLRTGKNGALLSDSAKLNSNNCTYEYTADNGITVTATGTYGRVAFMFPVKVGETYTISLKAYQTGLDFHKIYIDYGTTWDSHYGRFDLTTTNTEYSVTFTASTNIVFIGFYATGSSVTSGTMTVTELQLEHGSEATTYEPYTGNTYPYTLGQSVYGGTVDLATGVLTVTHVYYQRNFATPTSKDSQNRWVMSFYPPNASSALFGKMWDLTTYAADYGFLSDSLQIHLENAEVANASTCAFYGHGSAFEYRVRVPDTYTAAEAKAIADANHIVYPIEPTTIQLTPTQVKTLLGYNNISSTGTVDVIYHADTKLYVDKMTNVDNAIIAPTEETFTATRNYTVNDLVIVNDTLYKVTANIASGSAITPNSNVTATTLSALIKALS